MKKWSIRIILVIFGLFSGICCSALFLKANESRQINEQIDLGNRYLEELNYESAIVAYTKVIEVDPNNYKAYMGLAKAYELNGEDANAIAVYWQACMIRENQPESYLAIAAIYEKGGQYEDELNILQIGYEKTGNEEIKSILDEVRIIVTNGIDNLQLDFHMVDLARMASKIAAMESKKGEPSIYIQDSNQNGYQEVYLKMWYPCITRLYYTGNESRIRIDYYSPAGPPDPWVEFGYDNSLQELVAVTGRNSYFSNDVYYEVGDFNGEDGWKENWRVDEANRVLNTELPKSQDKQLLNHRVECRKRQIPLVIDAYEKWSADNEAYLGKRIVDINNDGLMDGIFLFKGTESDWDATIDLYTWFSEKTTYNQLFNGLYSRDYIPQFLKDTRYSGNVVVIAVSDENGVTFKTNVLPEPIWEIDSFEVEGNSIYVKPYYNNGEYSYVYRGNENTLAKSAIVADVPRSGELPLAENKVYEFDLDGDGTKEQLSYRNVSTNVDYEKDIQIEIDGKAMGMGRFDGGGDISLVDLDRSDNKLNLKVVVLGSSETLDYCAYFTYEGDKLYEIKNLADLKVIGGQGTFYRGSVTGGIDDEKLTIEADTPISTWCFGNYICSIDLLFKVGVIKEVTRDTYSVRALSVEEPYYYVTRTSLEIYEKPGVLTKSQVVNQGVKVGYREICIVNGQLWMYIETESGAGGWLPDKEIDWRNWDGTNPYFEWVVMAG